MFRLVSILLCCLPLWIQAQHLNSGFDPQEVIDILEIGPQTDAASNYTLLYTSPEIGFYNQWKLYKRTDGVLLIQIRGSVGKMESWISNFYAAMIPATGNIRLDNQEDFSYQFADSSSPALVHTGWTISLGFLIKDIKEKIQKYYNQGAREFILTGHSQGGAITYLLRSYLYYERTLPRDIVYKTYCTAAPKPGDQQYAYDFDYINRGGWAFRVVADVDWVPETPFSIQQITDFTQVNPFVNAKSLKPNNFFLRLYLNKIRRKLTKSTERAVRKYQKVLGKRMYKLSSRHLKELEQPPYAFSSNYMTAGTPIILKATPSYHQQFPFDGKNVFVHHSHKGYIYLIKSHYKLAENVSP